MVKVVWHLFYLLAAIGTGCEVSLYGGDMLGVGAGLLAFLFCLQIQASLSHRRERLNYEAEIVALRRSGLELEVALEATRGKMEAMTKVFDEKTSVQNRKIVSELRQLENLMREQLGHVSARTSAARHTPPLRSGRFMARVFEAAGETELLETIRASLEENRVDLLLQPIVGLPQRKLRFYEAYSRLRTEDGHIIMPKQYMGVAAPAGLMSVIDNLFLFRCVQIVRRLVRKNRDAAIFCNISAETLSDGEFFPQFLEYIEQNRDLNRHIVFEFAQGTFLKVKPEAAANLRALSRLGFALSMDRVETLAFDFDRANDLGVRFLKLKAEVLIEGARAYRAPVAAEDFKAFLSRKGIELIVEYVESEKTVVQLLDYSVDFAEGFLFGEPRAVREEALRPAPAPASKQSPARVIPLRRAG